MDSAARSARPHPFRLVLALTVWPIALAAIGNFAICMSGMGIASGWGRYWPIAVHLGVVAIAPAAALANVTGVLLGRTGHWLALFLIVPAVAALCTLGGIMLHYWLLEFPHLYGSSFLVLSSVAVAVLSLSLAVILVKVLAADGR